MGRKKNSLGRALIKDRFSGRRFRSESSLLHSADVADGYDWGRLNLQSVTEESSFQEFLSTAELAGTEFQAEKFNITFLSPASQVGLLSNQQKKIIFAAQEENKKILQIPRRPDWDDQTTSEELHSLERDTFLEWRRKLALFKDENSSNGLILTPYEKNIEFWRQLWRVVEKSDVVVQIVDARNPLLFRCEDLERYVEEVSEKQDRGKTNFILVNKADFLTKSQREIWSKFFNDQKIRMAFFSAIKYDPQSFESETEISEQTDETGDVDVDEINKSQESVTQRNDNLKSRVKESKEASKSTVNDAVDELGCTEGESRQIKFEDEAADVTKEGTSEDLVDKEVDREESESEEKIKNTSKIMTRQELIALLKSVWVKGGGRSDKNVRTVGMVGYPNVGKSSTINALLEAKKVSVSATPGKTKHFQTLHLDSELVLCDCPGLVMPSFVSTQAEMVLWGVLPVDRLRDHVPSVSLLTSLIPRKVLEERYGLMLPNPMEGEDPDRPPTSEELLNAYGYIRGYMTQRGLPDNPRTSRYVLKDFVNGKLLYCKAPPGHHQEDFHVFPSPHKKRKGPHLVSTATEVFKLPPQLRAVKQNKVSVDELDKTFFRQATIGVHSKGIKPAGIGGAFPSSEPQEGSSAKSGKPWKKHNNKDKREKLRRVYSYLDQ